MKIILIVILLFFACGVAMLLVARLQKTQQRLAELHSQLARNEDRLNQQKQDLDNLTARQPVQNTEGEIKS